MKASHVRILCGGVMCAVAGMAAQTAADITAIFQNGICGYASTQDAYIINFNPDINLNNSRLEMQGPATFIRSTLIRFDDIFGNGPGQIPAGSIITSASLVVEKFQHAPGSTADMHNVLVDWSESTVTWTDFNNGGVAGVDYDPVAVATGIDIDAPGSAPVSLSIDVTSSVQGWSDGTSNFGWILRGNSGNVGQFQSSESGAGEKPRLVVIYSATPPPCPADTNGDHVVDVSDLLAVLGAWGPSCGSTSDVNSDAVVNVLDLLILLGSWGGCPE